MELTEPKDIRATDIIGEVINLRETGGISEDALIGYETAAHLQHFGRDFECPIIFRETEPLNSDAVVQIGDGRTTVRCTSPLQTFCDILNRDEYVTGSQYEICCNILEHYRYPPNNLGGIEVLYNLALQQVPKKILDDNWEELQTFYDYD